MTPAPSWQTFLLGLGFGVGLILGIAALGGLFALIDGRKKRARRRRILRAAAKCRQCDYAGDLTEVALHEALDHHEETGRD
jgi:hypothetical protein